MFQYFRNFRMCRSCPKYLLLTHMFNDHLFEQERAIIVSSQILGVRGLHQKARISWPDLLLNLLNRQAPQRTSNSLQLYLSENQSWKVTLDTITVNFRHSPHIFTPKIHIPDSVWEHLESGRSMLQRLLGWTDSECVCKSGVCSYVY